MSTPDKADWLVPAPHKVIINGKFLTRYHTGVDRIAIEVSKRIRGFSSVDQLSIAIAVPKSFEDSAKHRAIEEGIDLPVIGVGIGRGIVWEQLSLLFVDRNAELLSFGNSGPFFRRRHFLFVHDAQFITQPKSYRLLFRTYLKVALTIGCRFAQRLATVSRHSLKELEQHRVFPEGKAVVIYNGADHLDPVEPESAVLTRLGLSEGKYFLAVGSLAPHKNVNFLIKAMKGRLPADAKLVVAGGGNSKLFKAVSINDVEDVVFAGRVSEPELAGLYKGAFAFLFPSLTEGFGLPPIEAMKFGCPVIASRTGAIPEVCGDAALYADPFDAESWMAAVQLLWSDGALRERLVVAGNARAHRYSWNAATVQILDALSVG